MTRRAVQRDWHLDALQLVDAEAGVFVLFRMPLRRCDFGGFKLVTNITDRLRQCLMLIISAMGRQPGQLRAERTQFGFQVVTGWRRWVVCCGLADLFDATGAPQLWCGTSNVVQYLQRGQANGRDSLAQIRRRIGIAGDLGERTRSDDGGPGEPLYTLDEIQRVFASGKMRITPEAMRYLWQLANTPDSGALGTATNLVSMAVAINERTATALTAEMLRTAHRMLVSRASFAAVEQSMHEPERRQAKAG